MVVGNQWTGVAIDVKKYSYNLLALNNESSVIFRFVFASDEAEHHEGVAIDNFTITATSILAVADIWKNTLKLYPNPSTAIFHIDRSNEKKMDVSVYDITGKLIYKEKNILSKNYILDVSKVEKGIYFLKIKQGGSPLTKRLLIQ